MTESGYRYLFGRPVVPRKASASSKRRLFVLGAYPSAIHVRWRLPRGNPGRGIAAIPIDNEPEPFWNGADADERVTRWLADIGFDDAWGRIDLPPGINGPSGEWVDSKLLKKFNASRSDAWITDCLDTYRASNGGMRAIKTRFAPFANEAGLELPHLAPHPSEDQIVAEARQPARASALREELRTAEPETIVTLGNAALRVMRELVDEIVGPDPGEGLDVESYGQRSMVRASGAEIAWYPLAHPAAPSKYQDAHKGWTPE